MYERFTDRARRVMQLANQEAQRFNHEYIGTEHILLGLVKEGAGVAATVLKNVDIDLRKVRLEVEKIVQSGPEMVTMGKLPRTPRAKKVLEYSMEEARYLQHSFVGTEHLLLGLLREEEGVAAQVLTKLGGSLDPFRTEVLSILGSSDSEKLAIREEQSPSSTWRNLKTPALDSFTFDLTAKARNGKLRPVVGREDEINQLLAVLGKLDRCSAVLIGTAGVGRRSIINGVANRIVSQLVSESVANHRVLELDQVMPIAGTKYRGQLEERTKAIVNEIRRDGKVILVVPQVHLLRRLGEFEKTGIAVLDAIKQAMVDGKIRCIGICSPDEYEYHLAGDSDFVKLFQPMHVQQPTAEQTLEILQSLKDTLEQFHHVEINQDAIEAAVELSDLYVRDIPFPIKAINLIDAAASQLGADRIAPDTTEFDRQIEQLTRKKEEAVTVRDYGKASSYLEEADKLKERKDAEVSKWKEDNSTKGLLGIEHVISALSLESGIPVDDIRSRKQLSG